MTQIRHRLDNRTAPKFDREEVEAILTELVSYQSHVEFLLTGERELRAQMQGLYDNLRDSEVEIGRLRVNLSMMKTSANSYRKALEQELARPGIERARQAMHVEDLARLPKLRLLHAPDEQGMTGCPKCGNRHPPDGVCV